MNDNQMMSLIIDRLDRIENKLDALPQCHYGEVKEQLARGRDRFDKLESKVDAKLDKSLFLWACGLPMGFIGLLLGLKKILMGE